ncbi:hypothetical protein HanXRQr2_Chr12g0526791 [Helianthus annuus]|uniref:Uncharacterized protein n=1 Tax=Helianthus annuus TaxID=4232 RepID=A0A9K3HEN8_HELAN|nr:hypothetical protein HanXRQr2_Chr12g0526791 [Helianthus annuus]
MVVSFSLVLLLKKGEVVTFEERGSRVTFEERGRGGGGYLNAWQM